MQRKVQRSFSNYHISGEKFPSALTRRGAVIFIATRHATSLLTPPRLVNGKRYSLSPTRFTTPSTSEASGRTASST